MTTRSWTRNWQYNGVGIWIDVIVWCMQNFEDDEYWHNGNDTVYFANDQAHTLFLLKWAGK